MTRAIISVTFEPSRVSGGRVATVLFSGVDASKLHDDDRPHFDRERRRWALTSFIEGSGACPFAQRQAARGRDAFPSRDPEDYVLTEVAPNSYKMEAK